MTTTEIIIVPSLDEEKRQKEYAITLSFDNRVEEKYSITQMPVRSSKLVSASEAIILRNLSVHEVVKGLDHSVNLMFLAYNALAARKNDPLQATVSGLQKSLLDANAEALSTVGTFKVKSQNIAETAFKAYGWLTKYQEKMAITQLKRCGDYAKEMADEAGKLADKYQKIGNGAQDAAEKAILQKVEDEKAKGELLAKLNTTKALQARTEELQKNIEKDLEEAQKEYEAAREREKVEGDRAFALGLVGAIFGGLASGVGSVAQAVIAIKSPIGLPGGYVPPKPTGSNNQQTGSQIDVSAAQQQSASISEQLKQKETEKQAIIDEQKANDKTLAAAEQKIKDPDSTPEVKKKAEEEKEEALRKKADIEKRLQTAEAAVNQLTSGLNNISQQLQQLSGQSHSAAETAGKQKMLYYEHKQNLAKENRQALADLKAYSIQIKYSLDDAQNITTAIQSLQFAIQALNGVVAALKNTELFWRNMASYCQNALNNQDLVKDVTEISTWSKEDRFDFYSSEMFLRDAIGNVASWVALNSVCIQYEDAVTEVYQKINHNIAHTPSDNTAASQVQQLAVALLGSAEREIAAMDEEIASLRREMESVKV